MTQPTFMGHPLRLQLIVNMPGDGSLPKPWLPPPVKRLEQGRI